MRPPALVIESVEGTRASTLVTFALAARGAARRRAGDVELAFLLYQGSEIELHADAIALGWAILDERTFGGVASLTLAARAVREDDDDELELRLGYAPTWFAGACAVYRGLEIDAVLATAQSTGTGTGGTTPSVAAVRYSDVYLGIVALISGDATVTPPAGARELADLECDGGGGRQLAVFDARPEVVGATGTYTFGLGASRAYYAVAALLAATGSPGQPTELDARLLGLGGLPRIGV